VVDLVAEADSKGLYGLAGAQSGGEGVGGAGYDDPCAALERDFTAAEGEQRHAAGWRRRNALGIATLIGAGWGHGK
jgi:hypothetical protein